MKKTGFTLIELSIVLVIIALIVGGVLVGRDLISAAEIRAQVSQIEKYQTAMNTFRLKYGYLPGDIPDPAAQSYGLHPRGADPSGYLQGNNDGMIQDYKGYGWNCCGESLLFWTDLAMTNLVDGSFTTAMATSLYSPTLAQLNQYIPPARIGNNNYLYVWNFCNGPTGCGGFKGNYLGISAVYSFSVSGGQVGSNTALTAQQAYAIDTKLDDGLPLTGRVFAQYLKATPAWAGTADATHAVTGDSTTCYDNGNNTASVVNYSVGAAGANLNCAISFKLQ